MSDESSAVVSESTQSTNTSNENTASPVTDESTLSELEKTVSETPTPKKYKVKIDGQDLEVDESELLSGYQSTKAAQQRFNEAARMRKQAEEFVKILKTDPKRALTHPGIGVDLVSFARDVLAEQLEEEMLSPQEKELRNTKKKLAEFEENQRRQEEALRQSEIEKYTKVYEEEYTTGIIDALAESGLPKTESTVSSIAKYMMMALENGLDVKPKDVVQFVKRDYIAQIKSIFGPADADTLLSLLGDDISNKVVKGHINKVKKGKSIPSLTEPTKPAGGVRRDEPKQMSNFEWREQLQKNLGRK